MKTKKYIVPDDCKKVLNYLHDEIYAMSLYFTLYLMENQKHLTPMDGFKICTISYEFVSFSKNLKAYLSGGMVKTTQEDIDSMIAFCKLTEEYSNILEFVFSSYNSYVEKMDEIEKYKITEVITRGMTIIPSYMLSEKDIEENKNLKIQL